MKSILFFAFFLSITMRVRSGSKPNMDYFVMTEAHISEYRHHEDPNKGYLPFYVECFQPASKHNCRPAVPKVDAREGYIVIKKSGSTDGSSIYYGCPQRINLENVLDPEQHYKKALIMRYTKSTRMVMHALPLYYNIYKYRCDSDVSPVLWKVTLEESNQILYGIGFLMPTLAKMPLAEVYYDYEKHIPIWTKHTLYGVSLAAPIAAFQSIENIIYETDSLKFTEEDLRKILELYYEFNDLAGKSRKFANEMFKLYHLEKLPDESKIVMGHLIPEYDMVTSVWKKVTQFAQTIVPTWEELYLNEWIDVEEMIREVSFLSDTKLTVYSGTLGQLLMNVPIEGDQFRPRFVMGTARIVVPEMIWKFVIDESPGKKKATMVIFRNITQKLIDLGMFAEITPPCNRICSRFQRKGIDQSDKPIFCCNVNEVIPIIHNLPIKTDEKYDVLIQ